MEEPTGVNEPHDDTTAVAPVDQAMPPNEPNLTNDSTVTTIPFIGTPKPKVNIGKRILLIVLAILLVGGVAYGVYYGLSIMWPASNHDTKATTTSTQQTSNSANSQASDNSTTAIENDLKGIDSDISASTSDQTSADSALSDSSQQITVPTE